MKFCISNGFAGALFRRQADQISERRPRSPGAPLRRLEPRHAPNAPRPGAAQIFRIPAEVRNRINMITGTMYLIMTR